MGRADVMAAVTGDDAVNLAACQIAKMRFNVPRSIARINDPKNEKLFRQLAIDEVVSPTRSILGVIEHEIPIHDLLHLAELEGGEVQIVEAQLDADSPVIGRELRELELPEGSTIARPHPRRSRPAATLGHQAAKRATSCWRSRRPKARPSCAACSSASDRARSGARPATGAHRLGVGAPASRTALRSGARCSRRSSSASCSSPG